MINNKNSKMKTNPITRRNFMKTTALATGALLVYPHILKGSKHLTATNRIAFNCSAFGWLTIPLAVAVGLLVASK